MASMRYEVTFNEADQKNQVILTALLTETKKNTPEEMLACCLLSQKRHCNVVSSSHS